MGLSIEFIFLINIILIIIRGIKKYHFRNMLNLFYEICMLAISNVGFEMYNIKRLNDSLPYLSH